ncbi:hypothetical protein pb186bvf_003947 [Paramecium bursaria]
MQVEQRIGVIGASGLVGAAVTEALLAHGFKINAVQRNPDTLSIDHQNLNKYKADALNAEEIEKGLEGVSKVLITVNRDPALNVHLFTQYAGIISQILIKLGINQIIYVAGMGLMKFGDKHGFEAPDYFPQFKDAALDHLGAVKIYEATGINLTVMCPPWIIKQPFSDEYAFSTDGYVQTAEMKVGTGQLANFILKEFNDQINVGKRVHISYVLCSKTNLSQNYYHILKEKYIFIFQKIIFMSDRQAQILERKRQIELLKQKQMETLQQTQQLQSAPVSNPDSTNISPQKQNEQQVQQPNMLDLYFQQKMRKLTTCPVEIFSYVPKRKEEVFTVEFGIQCESFEPEQQIKEEPIPLYEQQRRESRRKEQIPQSAEKAAAAAPVQVEKKISQEEINSMIQSQAFHSFFTRATKIVEKAIIKPDVDILEDIIQSANVVQEQAKDLITHQMNLSYPQYTQNRVVTSLSWSPNLPGTVLASYSQNEEGSISDQVGVALIWSLQLKSRPEFYCFSSSPITQAVFHPFSPSLIIGGLYNGQVVIWDIRTKQTPEKRTTLNSGGHSFPIYGLSVVGSQNAHNLISVSNDGKVCMWNMGMLNQPQKVIDLKVKARHPNLQPPGPQEVNVTCLGFPNGDANNFYIGSEDGALYKTKLHPNQNEDPLSSYLEHNGPITSVSINPSGPPFLQNLVLTSSYDWTVKLWNPRVSNQELMTFECSEDYVYDVAWNGQHSTMFTSVDGEGYVDLWDISQDLEAPITRHKSGQNSINKQSWNNDGSKLAIGDSVGNVQILQLQQKFIKQDNEKIGRLENLFRQEK